MSVSLSIRYTPDVSVYSALGQSVNAPISQVHPPPPPASADLVVDLRRSHEGSVPILPYCSLMMGVCVCGDDILSLFQSRLLLVGGGLVPG